MCFQEKVDSNLDIHVLDHCLGAVVANHRNLVMAFHSPRRHMNQLGNLQEKVIFDADVRKHKQ